MRHFSCDLCGKTLTPHCDNHYAVRIEGFAVTEAVGFDDTADTDAVEEMDELLSELERNESQSEFETIEMPSAFAKKEYDLCGHCYAKFLSDPLGLDSRRKLPFSRN